MTVINPDGQISELHEGFTVTGGQQLFADGFEGGWPGQWQRFGNPAWDRTDCRGAGGSQSVWPAGAGQGAVTPCIDDYSNNVNAWMTAGPFDLSGATVAVVTFQRWQSTEANYDWFQWRASKDGQWFYGWQSSGFLKALNWASSDNS